jgi:hypothetical protein
MRKLTPYIVLPALSALAATACGDKDDDRGTATQTQVSGVDLTLTGITGQGGTTGGGGDDSTSDASDGGGTTGGASATQGMTTQGSGGVKFDLGDTPMTTTATSGALDCEADPNQEGCKCTIPDHVSCDNGTNDPFNAMGLNCPGELQVQSSTYGNPSAIGVRSTFGQGGTFNAREGAQYAVIGSGLVGDLNKETPVFDSNLGPTHCNDDLGAYDPGKNLPAPLKPVNVGGDCTENLGLIGSGDCSNTIQAQFNAGSSGNDYTELRFILQVPPDVVSFSYDFAFFSVEYPDYYQSAFNDLYIGWLESENWTGNVSFDNQGNPISLNAGFLDFKDDPYGQNPIPQFQGTCMRQHAGTNWLTTTAGVTPGETITVVFAIMDLSDSILDSYVFLDNFKWGCEPTGKPQTMPPG